VPANTTELEKRLWEAADSLRANSMLKASEYSTPVLVVCPLRGRFNTLTIGESLTTAASVDPRTPPTRSCRLPQ
jgi:hypothetical protein